MILSKGRDVVIGPNAPLGEGHGYGDQWIPLHGGRAAMIGWGVWNLAKVRNAKVTVLQHTDPFPADALAQYLAHLHPKQDSAEQLKEWRRTSLTEIYNAVRSAAAGSGALTAAYEREPRLRYSRQALVCHVLRRAFGDDKFFEVVRTYQQLRTSSDKPVASSRFKEIAEHVHGFSLDWFFLRWASSDDLPSLQLSSVSAERAERGWVVRGRIVQRDPTRFQARVEVLVTTMEGDAYRKRIWFGRGKTAFEVQTAHRPERLEADPDYDLPSIRKMPLQLWQSWNAHSDLVVI